ncbi:MAG TPA: hypothetical protein VMZ91_02640 [Candidatus Paceibacterota bacterium]|nr:hypothetical protein [Candidatus Paceibacterota bacterium]
MATWYQKIFPRIKDVKSYISKISEDIKKIERVKNVYLWGSCHTNFDNPEFRVKDIDLITRVDIKSGDLVSINEDILSKNLSKECLEKEGFFPPAIKFSKQYIDIAKYNVDHWAVSADNKLLHWGPIFPSKEESDEVKKEAEEFAKKETGFDRQKIMKLSQEVKNKWYKYHEHYMNKYLSDMPSGWFLSEENKVNKILKNTKKL